MADRNVLLREGRGLLLAYDHGFEHGATDFNDESVDPAKVVKIAAESGVYTGIILQKGIAEKYYCTENSSSLSLRRDDELPPLIVKLNGKTSFHQEEEPYSPPLGTVEEAMALGAKAVGYTIYIGSEFEARMMKEFAVIEKGAHENGLSVIGWMYPRGKHVRDKETDKDILAYAARLGLELGCDFIKIHYTGDPVSFSWVVKAAGRAGVFVVGGPKTEESEELKLVEDVVSVGAVGLAVGRNVWQSSDPVGTSRRLAEKIFDDNSLATKL